MVPEAMKTSRAPMRVLYFVPQLSIGGTELQLLRLVSRLDPAEFLPAVWCPGPWGTVGDSLRAKGVPVFRQALSAKRPWTLARAAAMIRAWRPSIYHSFGYGAHWLDVAAAAAAGVPVRLTSRRNVRHWDPARRARWQEKVRNALTTAVTANSRAAAETCAAVEGVLRDAVRVIPNGAEIPEETGGGGSRRELGLPEDAFVIGCVANLKAVKAQSVLLDAFRRIADVHPGAYLVLLGEGPDKAALEAQRSRLGLDGRVLLLDSSVEAGAVYRSLDLYVHPSSAEGFPNAVLEAMAHGLPVVATAVGGVPELVEDAATGLLVPAGDRTRLAEAVLELAGSPLRRGDMGRRGRSRAQERFSVDAMVRAHASLYESLAERAAPLHAAGAAA